MEFKHKSVLLEETIDNLNIKPDGIYVDGTLGGAGHSYQIAKRLTGGGRLKFMPKDEPYFIFEPKPGTGTVIENARKLVESLSTLKDEE